MKLLLCLICCLVGCATVELQLPVLNVTMLNEVVNPTTHIIYNNKLVSDKAYVTIIGDCTGITNGGIYRVFQNITIVPREDLISSAELYKLAAEGKLPQIYPSYLLVGEDGPNISVLPVYLNGEIYLNTSSLMSFVEFMRNNNFGFSLREQTGRTNGAATINFRLSGNLKYADIFSFIELLQKQPWTKTASPVFITNGY